MVEIPDRLEYARRRPIGRPGRTRIEVKLIARGEVGQEPAPTACCCNRADLEVVLAIEEVDIRPGRESAL